MFPYLSAVMPQIAYAHSVRDFIRELLRRFIPGNWIDRAISNQDANFDARLDAAFAGLDEKTATEKDYCAKVVSVLCDEVSNICEVTRLVCINRGYRKYADTFLSTEKFIRMVLRQDVEKLERLNATLVDKSKPLCVLLRDVGAVLEDKPTDEIAVFGVAEAKKANAELEAIAADVKKTLKTGFKEVNDNIKSGVAAVSEKVDAVDAKVSRLRRGNKPRGRYTKEARALCWNFWETAANHEEVWCSVNTRITYEAVFSHYKIQLARIGVDSANVYGKIVHAEVVRRNRELQAKHDEVLRQKYAAKSNTKRGKNGIMPSMKNRAKSALALTLAIAGGLAAPLRSDTYAPSCLESGVTLSETSVASHSALPEPARAEIRGRVVKVADGDTITVLDAANAQHKILLYGIDAPEKSQAFGQKSKQRLSSLVFGKDVTVTWKSKDKYGRILGTVFVDGNDINLEMIRAGLVWHYKRYDKNPAYAAAEFEARQSKRGLWADSNPTPPEQFRKAKREKKGFSHGKGKC